MSCIEEYRKMAKELLEMRKRHELEEDTHLDKMDVIWDALSEQEINELRNDR
jgi:hypothetical protein